MGGFGRRGGHLLRLVVVAYGFGFGCNRRAGSGILCDGVVEGGFVEQGQCLSGDWMRGLLCGLLDESFGCGGLTLASELGQSQLSDVYCKEPASNGNFSTIAIAREECQTPNLAHVTGRFQCYVFGTSFISASCIC